MDSRKAQFAVSAKGLVEDPGIRKDIAEHKFNVLHIRWSHADARFTRHLPPTLFGMTNSIEAKVAGYDRLPLDWGGLGFKRQTMWKKF